MSIMYRLLAIILSIFASLGLGDVNPPATDDPITLSENSNLNFVLWGDTQVSSLYPSRCQRLANACTDLENSGITFDFLTIVGDIAENGMTEEYELVVDNLKRTSANAYLWAEGNHDVRSRIYTQALSRFTSFENELNEAKNTGFSADSYHYSYDVNGFKIIVLGTDKTVFEESWFSDEQLEWLDNELLEGTKDGLPVFVINHQPLAYTNGLPDTWGSPIDTAGSVGEQSDELFNIMNKYTNVFFVTGHLHTAFGEYLYEKMGNVHLVNVPSLTISSKDGIYNEPGTGFIVSVTDTEVKFIARDFNLGKYIPEGDIIIGIE